VDNYGLSIVSLGHARSSGSSEFGYGIGELCDGAAGQAGELFGRSGYAPTAVQPMDRA
jgi:hypothetical protein